MKIEDWLKKIGLALIILSVIGSIIILIFIDHGAYWDAKKTAEELWDNSVAQEQYASALTTYIFEIALVIGSLFSGVIGGLLLIGFSTLIALQRKNIEISKDQLHYIKLSNQIEDINTDKEMSPVDRFIKGEKVKNNTAPL
ncbi:hypothetical protein CHH83_20590 [Bacillus sp. 7586-K]|nr:hypothetical protein CHH83_20590 [Bacillus sp. 7586-K]